MLSLVEFNRILVSMKSCMNAFTSEVHLFHYSDDSYEAYTGTVSYGKRLQICKRTINGKLPLWNFH